MSCNGNSPDCTQAFSCKQCGDCCRGYGGTYVTDTDIRRISEYTGIDEKRLKSDFCRSAGNKYILGQRPDGYCIFWDETCRIHPVKPKMCKDLPFIAALLKEIGNWRTMSEMCPGMNPDAPENLVISCVKQNMQGDSRKKCQ